MAVWRNQKDVKAGDADDIPKDLKDRWRSRIEQQLKKEKQPEKKKDEKQEYLTDSQREALEKEDDQDSSGN